ncbi:MAG TPA: ABC transporter substrate-binding protein [Solirubrobacteraceae bacterium]
MQINKRRRGRLAIVAMSLLVVSMLAAACGSSSSSTSSGTTTTPAKKKAYRVTLIVGITNNPFYTSMARGAQAAAKELGVTLDVQGATEFSPSAETPIINAVIAKKPDGIVLVPTDAKAIDPLAKQASAAGITIATADIDVATPSSRIAFFASDNEVGGQMAGKQLIKDTGGKGKVFVLADAPNVPTGVARVNGFKEAIKGSGLKMLPVQYSDEQQGKGTSVVDAVLQGNPDLAGIFAEDTINGQATAVSLQNAHKVGKVKAVAFDASPSEVVALRKGIFSALIGQKPYLMGDQAVRAIVEHLNGDKTKWHGQKIDTGFQVITKDNMDDPDVSKFIYR